MRVHCRGTGGEVPARLPDHLLREVVGRPALELLNVCVEVNQVQAAKPLQQLMIDY